jgi:sortase (surface protein transpeptidase)
VLEQAVVRLVPVRLEIPAIGVRTGVTAIGVRADGSLDAPASGAAWFERSPAPGETGAAVIVGAVAGRDGPEVFARLRLLCPGDLIEVGRTDGSVVRFVVTGVAIYPRSHFPGTQAHGPRDEPALTLLTCGSDLDHSNHVVFARSC